MSNILFQFTPQKSKSQVLLDRYQYLLSIAATLLFFSDLSDYLNIAKILPINSLAWIVIFSTLSLPFIKKIATVPKPLLAWMSLYVLLSMLSLATVSSDEVSTQDFRNRILSVIFICLIYIIYEQKSLKHVKYAILAVVLMTVVNNFYELLNPRFFSELNSGRPAGFYINPNKTGCSLVLGLIFTIDVIKKQYRWPYVLLVGSGIVTTFSRGSILGWTICALILTMARVLSDKRRTVIISAFALALLLTFSNPLQTMSGYFQGGDGAYYDVLDRLEQFQNPSLEDDSASERKAVAGYGWLMFGKHPFWGNGLGSTNKWAFSDVSTHNMYLYYMADHGIIGAIILPGAILAVVWRNRGNPKAQVLCFAIFMSVWGIFSHNVLEERYILLTFGLLAALNTNQKWYLKYSNDCFQAAPVPENSRLILPPARRKRSIDPTIVRPPLPPNHK
jgi:O-Antigen ligase